MRSAWPILLAVLVACQSNDGDTLQQAPTSSVVSLVTATLDSARVYAWELSYANRLDVWSPADPGLLTVTQNGQTLASNTAGTPQGGGMYRYWIGQAPAMDAPIQIASAQDTICWGWDEAPCLPDFAMRDQEWLDLSAISRFSNMLAQNTEQQVSPSTGIAVAVDSVGNLMMYVPATAPGGWKTNYQDLLWQTVKWRARWNQ